MSSAYGFASRVGSILAEKYRRDYSRDQDGNCLMAFFKDEVSETAQEAARQQALEAL